MIEEKIMNELNKEEVANITRAMSDEEKEVAVMNVSTSTLLEEIERRTREVDALSKDIKDFVVCNYNTSAPLTEKENFIKEIRRIARVNL